MTELIQVRDNADSPRWHAAVTGVGILCRLARDDVSRKFRWEPGTHRVKCRECLERLAADEAVAA